MNSINGNKIGTFGADNPKDYDQAIRVKKYPFLNKIRLWIYNKDGSEADMCGNAVILVAKDFFKKTKKKKVEIVLNKRTIDCSLKGSRIYCNMGSNWSREDRVVNLDNLHYIAFSLFDIRIKPIITKFANYHFVKNFSFQKKEAHIETIEKGAGETLSCGSGAIATFLFLRKGDFRGMKELKVISKGGYHYVKMDKHNNIYLIYEMP